MKYLKQIIIILAFTGLGELLTAIIPFPIPAAIYGLILLLIALCLGIVKPGQVKETSDYLISVMPVLYVPACVRILEYWGVISQSAAAILTVIAVSTFLVFAVSALVTQRIVRRKGDKNHG